MPTPATVTLPMVVAQAVAAISLGLLAASGIAKLVDPAPTTGAMKAAGLPASRSISYALGLAETVIAVVALAIGSPFALVSASGMYVAFTAFTFSAVRKRIPVQSCGCFGREDTPPNYVHVAYNAVASISLLLSTTQSVGPIDWSLPPGELIVYVGYVVIGVSASYLVLARLPQVLGLRKTT